LPDALTRVVEIAGEQAVELAVPVGVDLAGVLGTLAPTRPAGIGIAVRPGALAVSLRQARSALPESRLSGRHVHAADIASSRQLLAAVPAERLQGFADAVLGPLDAADLLPAAAELPTLESADDHYARAAWVKATSPDDPANDRS